MRGGAPLAHWWRIRFPCLQFSGLVLRMEFVFEFATNILLRMGHFFYCPSTSCFTRVATTSSIEILKTPVHAPRANAVCERFLRSVRQECLDHLLILHERQLQRVLNAYVMYFNQPRPHQGIHQQIPEAYGLSRATAHEGTKVVTVPILAGLHHDYRKVA